MADTIIDTNVLGSLTDELNINSSSQLGIYTIGKTGNHLNHMLQLEISPNNGDDWIGTQYCIRGQGHILVPIAGDRARMKTVLAEGSVSTTDVFLIPR